MPDPRLALALCLTVALAAPTALYAGGGGGGYVSDAPIPWHMSQDEEGRNVIELIEHAEQRLGLEIAEVTMWRPPMLPEPGSAQMIEEDEGNGAHLVSGEPEAKLETETPRTEPHLAVPYQGLIYWADGTTWLYGEISKHHYTRLPVEVGRIEGGTVLLVQGPPEGTRIVTFGAAELFGVETGIGH